MKKRVIYLFLTISLILISFVTAESISEDLHLNIQTTDATGSVVTGTFAFVFNISTNSNCSVVADVVYSNSTTLTTDSRGIISYYLEDVNLSFSEQYWLCYYRNETLINSSKIARTPYSFTAKNVSAEGVINDSNMDLTGYNITSSWFKGLFNWTISAVSNLWLSFTGSELSFNETKLNETIDSKVVDANTTMRIWVIYVNGTMKSYIDSQDTSYNDSMKSYVDGLNGTWSATDLDGYDSGFFMPLNTSIYGNFSFNGGWENEGLSIIDGDIFAQTGYFYNITGLDVNTLKINGSLLPAEGFDNQFNIGSAGLRWKDIFLSGNIYANDANLAWGNLTDYPTACASGETIAVIGDTITCAAISIIESQVSDADWWDEDADILADEISEGKIAFSTACPSGSYYYLNGNDLACRADPLDTIVEWQNLCTDCVVLGTDTTGNYAGSNAEAGSANNAFACSADSVCNTVGLTVSTGTISDTDTAYVTIADGLHVSAGTFYSEQLSELRGNVNIRDSPTDYIYSSGGTRVRIADDLGVDGQAYFGGNADPGTWEVYASGQIYVSDYLRADGGITTDATDPGTNRLRVGDYAMILGGAHIGGTSDPGTDNLVVDGNVGIGTTTPSTNLTIKGNMGSATPLINVELSAAQGGISAGSDEAWHYVGTASEPAFQNSWVNYGAGYVLCRFRKDAMGYVHVQGMVKSGTSGAVFQLPVGYRPVSYVVPSAGIRYGELGCRVHAEVGGNINLFGYHATWTSFNIHFFAEQ